MDIYKIKLLINTIIHLKPIQVYYRIYYFIRNRLIGYEVKKKTYSNLNSITWVSKLSYKNSYFKKENTFTFLNISNSFSGKIDWNFNKYGKLWTYNLNYFDFLNQENISKETGIILIKDYVNNNSFLKDGKEPYPISLRGINWVKFLSLNQIKDEFINNTLYHHYCILLKNLEYQLLGNHLLENAFSLLFGAYYFQDEILYIKSKKLLIRELNEQILRDGGHYELSPMYHQLIFTRLLDCIQLIQLNTNWKQDNLIVFLLEIAQRMNSWLQNITYRNGDIPMVNDATFNIASDSSQLFTYSEGLGVQNTNIKLSDSGYRKIKFNNYELFIDVGNIGPDYQPGHAHSDTFSFELYKKNIPIIIDSGISTYDKNALRQKERGTSSHNTVQLEGLEQTNVWGGFRVSKRAKIVYLYESKNFIKASHNGYFNYVGLHYRSFLFNNNSINIIDTFSKKSSTKKFANFHLHNKINVKLIEENIIQLNNDIKIMFNSESIKIKSYYLSKGFNKRIKSNKITVCFYNNLKTTIYL